MRIFDVKCETYNESKITVLFLGATPDGIFNNCCVEVKCPYTRREEDQEDWKKMTNTELGTFFLKNTDEGLRLDENHIYFTQCQIQMYVLGLKMTHFVVQTKKGLYTEEIPFAEKIVKDKVSEGSELYRKYFIEEYLLQKYVYELEMLN